MTIRTYELLGTFAVLKPDMSVAPISVTPTIYEELARDFNGFKDHSLVSIYEFSEPWSSWEVHPAGDEIVILLSGSAKFRVRAAGGEESVSLDTVGSFLVVPRNTWHTAETSEQTRMLFITPGEGTENKADTEGAA